MFRITVGISLETLLKNRKYIFKISVNSREHYKIKPVMELITSNSLTISSVVAVKMKLGLFS